MRARTLKNKKKFPLHCVKSVCIRSSSGPYFPAFGLYTERYFVSLCTQSECRKIWTRTTFSLHTLFQYGLAIAPVQNTGLISPIRDGGGGGKNVPLYRFFPCNFYKRRNWPLKLSDF